MTALSFASGLMCGLKRHMPIQIHISTVYAIVQKTVKNALHLLRGGRKAVASPGSAYGIRLDSICRA
jgi:hypothetical protein